mmetsp:Transcript_11961/g.26600  ORF Transcript_11961/g.26600 Transcript_11961/m.26600 type:complete len:274 (-) Transcript_11961:137-958(-)
MARQAQPLQQAMGGSESDDGLEEDVEANLCCPHPLSCCLSVVGFPLWICNGVKMLEQNEHAAVLVWGGYVGSITAPGLQFVNPCGVELRKISTMRQTLDIKDVQVSDLDGNPVILSGNVAFKFYSAKKAQVDTRNPMAYIADQAPMVLRKIGASFRYDDLRGDNASAALVIELQKSVSDAGVEVLKFQLTDLKYSPLIAQAMLGKQQADVQVQASRAIVFGAVDSASGAVMRLKQAGHSFTPEAEQRLIHDLLLKNMDPRYKSEHSLQTQRQG